jgi:uncharacterized protein DUF1902
MARPIVIHADWDAEGGVWVGTTSDLRGLVTEAETIEALRAKLPGMTCLRSIVSPICGPRLRLSHGLATHRPEPALTFFPSPMKRGEERSNG